MSQMEKFTCIKCQKKVRQVPNDSIEGWLCQKCADKFMEKFGPCNICDNIITGPKFFKTQFELKMVDIAQNGEPDKEDMNIMICVQCIKEGIGLCQEDGFFHAIESLKDFTDDEGNKKKVCLDCYDDLVNESANLELVHEGDLDEDEKLNPDLDEGIEDIDEHDIDRFIEEEEEIEEEKNS